MPSRRGGERIPGLVISSRLEGPGLIPPPPPSSPPAATASPRLASFSCFTSRFFPVSRSIQMKSAPARPPPTSRADQTAPMAERPQLQETTGGDRDRGSGHSGRATPTPPAPAFYGPSWQALPGGAQPSATNTQLSQPRPGAAAPGSVQARLERPP